MTTSPENPRTTLRSPQETGEKLPSSATLMGWSIGLLVAGLVTVVGVAIITTSLVNRGEAGAQESQLGLLVFQTVGNWLVPTGLVGIFVSVAVRVVLRDVRRRDR